MTLEQPDNFKQAMALPTAEYYTPKLADVTRREARLVRMSKTGITNATSRYPVIGTPAFNPCTAVILYNTRTKTAGVIHNASPNQRHIDALMASIRPPGHEEDRVDAHIIGAPFANSPEEVMGLDKDSINQGRIDCLTDALTAIAGYAHTEIKTFDVFDKKKPHAVAFDTRNGRLIRGSALFKTEEQADHDIRGHKDLFSSWHTLDSEENFDGTQPKYQKQIGR